MLTNAFVFICVRASSALVRASAFLQPVVRGQVYSFEISPPLLISVSCRLCSCCAYLIITYFVYFAVSACSGPYLVVVKYQ